MTHEQAAYRRHPLDAEAPTAGGQPQAELRDRIAEALYERERPPRDPHWADAFAADREVFEAMADAVVPVVSPAADRAADDLAIARATNQRLNLRAQRLESELAAYRRAVADWEITDTGTYVPLRTLAAIAKAAGLDVPDRWELHYERVEHAEAELRRLAAEAQQQPTDEEMVEAHRLALSFTLGDGAEAQQQCPEVETVPNRCTCDCEGCKHHCGAHNPAKAQQPECAASISGNCLRESQSETACDTGAGECVGGGPGAEAQQPDTETPTDEPPTEEQIVRDHVTSLHLIGEQLSQIESWFWGHLADVREAARQELGGPLPDDAVPVQPTADDPQDGEAGFGVPGCTCKPWTVEHGKRRFMEPGETADRISGWHLHPDCPHHSGEEAGT